MAFEIAFSPLADEELAAIRAFERRRIIEDVIEQLAHEPDLETRRRKLLRGVVTANFDFEPPMWELKVGEYRAFYDVNAGEKRVTVRSVRYKPPDRTTEDVLHAKDHP